MLKINQLISGYGSVQILNGANMKVEKQSIVALLGGNGTGKSTILRAASGLIRSWKGTIEFNGEQIQNLPAHEIVGKGLVQVTQGKDVFPAMSVTENLKLGGFILKSKQQLSDNLEKVYNYFPKLKNSYKFDELFLLFMTSLKLYQDPYQIFQIQYIQDSFKHIKIINPNFLSLLKNCNSLKSINFTINENNKNQFYKGLISAPIS